MPRLTRRNAEVSRRTGPPGPPAPHRDGALPPAIAADKVPQHVAIVMDGNGRRAKQRGLSRTEGHAQREHLLFAVIQIGVKSLSACDHRELDRLPDEVRWRYHDRRSGYSIRR